MIRRTLTSMAALASLSAASSAAITFSNFTFNADAAAAGFVTPTVNGNALLFQPGNADVGDFSTGRSSTIQFAYDVTSSDPLSSASSTSQVGVFGNGIITFQQSFIRLDASGNELGLLGTSPLASTFATGLLPSSTTSFLGTSSFVRVVNTFTLNAPASAGVEFASIGQINQSVTPVPEPASMAALAIGAGALLRRRRSRA